MSQYSNHYAADSQPDTDPADDDTLADYHDRTLWEYLRCAEELNRLGHTAADLGRLVERHLVPETCPYPETGDPIPLDSKVA